MHKRRCFICINQFIQLTFFIYFLMSLPGLKWVWISVQFYFSGLCIYICNHILLKYILTPYNFVYIYIYNFVRVTPCFCFYY